MIKPVHLLFLFIPLSFSCQEEITREASLFFDDCRCEKLDLSQAFRMADSLHQFSVMIPSSSWNPQRGIEGNHSLLNFGDSIDHGFSVISLTYSNFKTKNYNWKADQDAFESAIHFLKKGNLVLNDMEYTWYQVLPVSEEGFPFVYMIHIDKDNGATLTVNLMSIDSVDPKTSICQLESILNTVEIH